VTFHSPWEIHRKRLKRLKEVVIKPSDAESLISPNPRGFRLNRCTICVGHSKVETVHNRLEGELAICNVNELEFLPQSRCRSPSD